MSVIPFQIGYARPSGISWLCVGTGASFATDPASLNNGITSDQTAVVWPTSGNLKLQCSWPTAQNIGCVSMRGTSLLAGTKVIVTGKRPIDAGFTYALGGNAATQRVMANNEGSLDNIVTFTPVSLIGIQVEIDNDVNGSTGYTAGEYIYIGGIDPFNTWSPSSGITAKWNITPGGVPAILDAYGNQPQAPAANPYRIMTVSFSFIDYKGAWGDSTNPALISYDYIAAQLLQRDTCIVMPRAFDASGNVDPFGLHMNSVQGIVDKIDKPNSLGGNLFDVPQLVVRESPAL